MTKTEVMALLKAHRNERGLKHWKSGSVPTGDLKSFGIGLTQLRKLAKQVGRDHALAEKLWKSDNHDARIIGLLIDDPKKLTREQVEAQVEDLEAGYLSHVFSSCGATLAKAPFACELAGDWIQHQDLMRRSCGYGLIYELSKDARNAALSDAWFLDCIKRIRDEQKNAEPSVRASMGGALMGIGKRNKKLNQAALKLARVMGPIEYGGASEGCEPLDVVKHLTSDYLKEKLGV